MRLTRGGNPKLGLSNGRSTELSNKFGGGASPRKRGTERGAGLRLGGGRSDGREGRAASGAARGATASGGADPLARVLFERKQNKKADVF